MTQPRRKKKKIVRLISQEQEEKKVNEGLRPTIHFSFPRKGGGRVTVLYLRRGGGT